MIFCTVGIRFKYYVGWSMGESAIIASGQAYNGQDPETKIHKFDRFYSANIHLVELGVFMPTVTESWNHTGHLWLKRYIYFRMNRLINKDLALYLTYITSALWHGLYPAYFVTFIFYAIFSEAQKDWYKICCKYPKLRSPIVLICIYIFTFLGIAYAGMIFTILVPSDIKSFVRGIYWIPIFYVAIFIFTKLTRNFTQTSIAFTKERKKIITPGKKEAPIIPYDLAVYETFIKKNEAVKINHRS